MIPRFRRLRPRIVLAFRSRLQDAPGFIRRFAPIRAENAPCNFTGLHECPQLASVPRPECLRRLPSYPCRGLFSKPGIFPRAPTPAHGPTAAVPARLSDDRIFGLSRDKSGCFRAKSMTEASSTFRPTAQDNSFFTRRPASGSASSVSPTDLLMVQRIRDGSLLLPSALHIPVHRLNPATKVTSKPKAEPEAFINFLLIQRHAWSLRNRRCQKRVNLATLGLSPVPPLPWPLSRQSGASPSRAYPRAVYLLRAQVQSSLYRS